MVDFLQMKASCRETLHLRTQWGPNPDCCAVSLWNSLWSWAALLFYSNSIRRVWNLQRLQLKLNEIQENFKKSVFAWKSGSSQHKLDKQSVSVYTETKKTDAFICFFWIEAKDYFQFCRHFVQPFFKRLNKLVSSVKYPNKLKCTAPFLPLQHWRICHLSRGWTTSICACNDLLLVEQRLIRQDESWQVQKEWRSSQLCRPMC